MLKVYNETAKYINQSGKRKGSFAVYLEPWHADIYDFLNLKKTHGDLEKRAFDLFYAVLTKIYSKGSYLSKREYHFFRYDCLHCSSLHTLIRNQKNRGKISHCRRLLPRRFYVRIWFCTK